MYTATIQGETTDDAGVIGTLEEVVQSLGSEVTSATYTASDGTVTDLTPVVDPLAGVTEAVDELAAALTTPPTDDAGNFVVPAAQWNAITAAANNVEDAVEAVDKTWPGPTPPPAADPGPDADATSAAADEPDQRPMLSDGVRVSV